MKARLPHLEPAPPAVKMPGHRITREQLEAAPSWMEQLAASWRRREPAK